LHAFLSTDTTWTGTSSSSSSIEGELGGLLGSLSSYNYITNKLSPSVFNQYVLVDQLYVFGD
jgi:hypothetical protein